MKLLILNYDMFSGYYQSFLFVPRIVDCAGVEDIVFVCKEQDMSTVEILTLDKAGLYYGLYRRGEQPKDISRAQIWPNLQAGNPVRIHWRPTGGIYTTDIFPMKLVPSSVVV